MSALAMILKAAMVVPEDGPEKVSSLRALATIDSVIVLVAGDKK